jgi:TIR domain
LKIFISWSGQRSRAVAAALKEWLPLVIEGVEPWVSDKDITAGERWSQSVAGELESANFGVICITPENLNADWILFEAGALSKSMQEAKVVPLLFDLDYGDISGPLAQFQAKKLDRDGVREVVNSVNKCVEKPTSDDVVQKRFESLWTSLEESLKQVPAREPTEKNRRSQSQILEDLVSTVRSLEMKFRDTAFAEPSSRSSKRRRMHPDWIFELTHFGRGEGSPGIVLPAMAGMLRDDAPWIAEILLDANRDLSDGSKARRSVGQGKLKALGQMLERGHPLMRDMMESKESYYLIREMSHMLISDYFSNESAVEKGAGLTKRESGDAH